MCACVARASPDLSLEKRLWGSGIFHSDNMPGSAEMPFNDDALDVPF